MRFVYFGDGLWATNCLQRLLDDGHEVLAVVARCKPSDRTLQDFAASRRIQVLAPENANDQQFIEWIRRLKPALNISMSYDQILRQPILESAPLGFINCHAGKLPFYRGRNIINWAIINNETEIGLTVHFIDEGIDTGDILLQRTLRVNWEDTYGSVLEKVQTAFPDLLAEAVRLLQRGEAHRRAQSHLEGTYYSSRIPGDEWIDWNDSSLNIYNKIRAITRPGPGARTTLNGQTLTLWRARYNPDWPKYVATVGEVVGVLPGQGVRVKTGDSVLILESVQFEGETEVKTPQFRIGTRFGINLFDAFLRLQKELIDLRECIGRIEESHKIC